MADSDAGRHARHPRPLLHRTERKSLRRRVGEVRYAGRRACGLSHRRENAELAAMDMVSFEHVDNVPGITTEPKPPAGIPLSFNDPSKPQALDPPRRPAALSPTTPACESDGDAGDPQASALARKHHAYSEVIFCLHLLGRPHTSTHALALRRTALRSRLFAWSFQFQSGPRSRIRADSDEAGHAFQFEAGRAFRSEAGHPWRRSHGSIS